MHTLLAKSCIKYTTLYTSLSYILVNYIGASVAICNEQKYHEDAWTNSNS